MPILEYRCGACAKTFERIIWKLPARTARCRLCGSTCHRIPSVPTMRVWDSSRSFENVSRDPMTFPSERAYRDHLQSKHIDEWSHTAPIKRSHGSRRKVYG